jgi:hypothetical protein
VPDRNIGKVSSSPETTTAARRRGGARMRRPRPELRRPSPVGFVGKLRATLTHPASLPGFIVALALSLVLAAAAIGGRWSVSLEPGRVSDQTYAARVDFAVVNEDRTASRRENREATTPRVYRADDPQFEALRSQLSNLPAVVATAGSLDDVPTEVRLRYRLTPTQFKELKGQTVDGQVKDNWKNSVARFIDRLRRRPLLSENELQQIRARGTQTLLLTYGDGSERQIVADDAISLGDPDAMRAQLETIARNAQFYGELVDIVVKRVVNTPVETFSFDAASTDAKLARASEVVKDSFIEGQVLVARGEVVDARDIDVLRAERRAYLDSLGWARRGSTALGMWAVMAALVAGLAGYVYLYNRRVVLRPWRGFAIAALIAGGQIAAVWIGLAAPGAAWLGFTLAVTLVTMVVVTAYDRRMSLVIAGVTVAAIGVAMGLAVAHCFAIFAAAATAAWRLGEIRSRADVVRATVLVMAAVALGVAAVTVIERPATAYVTRELPWDITLAALGGFIAGAITLFLMPTVERVFDVTTGMTLSELRDPKQPLLRMLQQRAPGTYNHSLNVATIAEAAARAIGADALHLYVGCLYHDVGKLNKPDYFVENQPRGLNKHDRLSPAMSLLVIMGHVKDGLELAAEYNLPRSLHHYIESHHGETLVTFFYHQAKQAAESDDTVAAPDEIEYRYPGPKPRTKEAAILMLCDAVEGATRAMSEPTPSRIAALVHDIAMARLSDGQFDDSELTFAELKLIEDAVTKSLCSIYHGRIAYPAAADPKEDQSQPKRDRARQATS